MINQINLLALQNASGWRFKVADWDILIMDKLNDKYELKSNENLFYKSNLDNSFTNNSNNSNSKCKTNFSLITMQNHNYKSN